MSQPGPGFRHEALLYRGVDEYVPAVVDFLRAGLDAGEPVFVAVPGPRMRLLREALNGEADEVAFADMTQLGRNPGRIIPAIREFIDRQEGRRSRFVGEPIWHGRGACEIREATRHEALINLAFADAAVTVVCPYDAAALDPAVLADAERTHPIVVGGGATRQSGAYADPWALPSSCEEPLSAPPESASELTVGVDDLGRLRRMVADRATGAGLGAERVQDLQLAVNEVATNSLRYGGPSATARIWQGDAGLVCQVEGLGHIADPLAGRRAPEPTSAGGRGLWLVHLLCDLVEVRSSQVGTVVRLTSQPR
jgi:anti-sigma regulatory factor (Ser/Thr protein kinase)